MKKFLEFHPAEAAKILAVAALKKANAARGECHVRTEFLIIDGVLQSVVNTWDEP